MLNGEHHCFRFKALFSLTLLATTVAFCQTSAEQRRLSSKEIVQSLTSAVRPDQAAISPDGNWVAWVQPVGNPDGPNGIFVENLNGGPAHRVGSNCAKCDEHDVAWSPDSKQIAFFSDAGAEGQSQLYVAEASKASAHKLTHLKGYLADPKWSRDGKQLAVLFTENAPRTAGPLAPMTPPSGVIGATVYEQRLALVDSTSGRVQQISPKNMYVYEFDWSPDSANLVMTAAPGAGDANWYVAQIYTVSSKGGDMKSIFTPAKDMQLAVPRWSPDGRQVAFIGGIMSDEGLTGGDIYVVSASGGTPRDITPGIATSPTWLEWQKPDEIFFAEIASGDNALATVSLRDGGIKTLWRGPESVTMGGEISAASASLAAGSKAEPASAEMISAVIKQSFANPPEVWAGPVGSWKQISHENSKLHPMWGEAKNFSWMSDGHSVEGWLLFPRNYDASQKYPMVVVVHGGPASAVVSSWPRAFYGTAALAVNGYFVFMPNPRGSYGQGEEFTRGNVKDFGYGDLRDIMSGVDGVVSQFPVDAKRIGITGWSYGGFMTMWALTQTDRFRAGVAGAGLSNWQSYYGENDIDQWMIPYFGATVYDDPAVYAKSSPINFIKKVKTPTLIVVGDSDGEVPLPQSFEYWHALKTLGVETELVVYPHEGHRISQPEHVEDIITRLVGWFDAHMPESEHSK